MGWTSDEDGDTSAHASESDSVEDIPPLKKARYVWQIKGKYHLKESEEKRAIIREGPVLCTCNEFASTSKEVRVTRQPSAHIATAQLDPFTRAPINMLQQSAQKSWQLHRWQARQVARCFVDNTINRVLEDMGLVPLAPGNAPPPSLLEEGAEQSSMDNREGHNVLEDEAVLMAIHSYGLQRASALSQQQRHRQAVPVSAVSSDGLQRASALSQQQHHCQAVPVGMVSSDGLERASTLCQQQHHRQAVPVYVPSSDGSQLSTLSQQQHHSQAVPVSKASSDGLQQASALSQQQLHHQAVPVSMASSDAVVAEHGDFLDAAVTVAIEKKGLGTLSSAVVTGTSGDSV